MSSRIPIVLSLLLIVALLLISCGQRTTSFPESPGERGTAGPEPTEEPRFVWNQLLSRDAIVPSYEPEFVPAGEAGYDDDELVMGVAINGEAKAYPMGLLHGREMVNDELGGLPILVTW